MSSQLRSLWIRTRLPLIVLAIGAMLSLALSYAAQREIARSAQVRFDSEAATVARKVEDQFNNYTEVLIGLRALFNTSDMVARSQFHEYVTGLGLQENLPGFRVLNFAPYVPAAQRRTYEESNGFAIAPAGVRTAYYPLTFMEPREGNERVLGKDMGALPTALTALEKARDTGALTSSGKTIRVNGSNSEIGLAMRLPVYRRGMPLDSVEQRRADGRWARVQVPTAYEAARSRTSSPCPTRATRLPSAGSGRRSSGPAPISAKGSSSVAIPGRARHTSRWPSCARSSGATARPGPRRSSSTSRAG